MVPFALSGEKLDPPRRYCYSPLFAHDEVHPSARGHAYAHDLIVHALASGIRGALGIN